jgi:hypothetical protein
VVSGPPFSPTLGVMASSSSGWNAHPTRKNSSSVWWFVAPGGVLVLLGLLLLGSPPPASILFVVGGLLVAVFGFTIWAMIDAFKGGKGGWGGSIFLSWLVGLGWLAAIIYCLVGRRSAVSGAASRRHAAVQVGSNPSQTSTRAGVLTDIREIAELHEAGILTDTEFAAKKTDLLLRM